MNTNQTTAPVVYGYAVVDFSIGGKPMYGIGRTEQEAIASAVEYSDGIADALTDGTRRIRVIKLDQRCYELCDDGGWDSVGFRESTETDAGDSDFYVWIEGTEA